MKNLIITNGTIVTDELIHKGTIVVIGDRIIYVGDQVEGDKIKKTADTDVFEIIDAKGGYIAPGLIDVHMHGVNGAELMDANSEALRTMGHFVVQHGTVAFLPSTVTASKENTKKVSQLIADYNGGDDEAEILGIHLEGPYINEEYKGAQYGPAIRHADLKEMEELYAILGEKLRLVTLAPEVEENLHVVPWLTERGVVVSMGHTNATYEQALAGFEQGINYATHTYNGMRGLHHREPGALGAILATPHVWAELIADLIHVHPGAIKVLLNAKSIERTILVSDAVQATGLPDGKYVLGDLDIFVKDGAARLAEGNLAGSTLTLITAVKNMVEAIGVSIPDAFRMASQNPAKALGLKERGWIREGNLADIIIVSPEFEVKKTIIRGKVVYNKN